MDVWDCMSLRPPISSSRRVLDTLFPMKRFPSGHAKALFRYCFVPTSTVAYEAAVAGSSRRPPAGPQPGVGNETRLRRNNLHRNV